MTFAFLKFSGKMPVLMLRLKILVRGSAIMSVLIFKNLALSPSRPVALDVSRDCNCLRTNVKVRRGI